MNNGIRLGLGLCMLSSALTHAEAGLVVASNLAAGNVMGGNRYLSGAHQGSVISAQIQSVSALAQAQAQTQAQVQAQAQERQERQQFASVWACNRRHHFWPEKERRRS